MEGATNVQDARKVASYAPRGLDSLALFQYSTMVFEVLIVVLEASDSYLTRGYINSFPSQSHLKMSCVFGLLYH